MSKELIATLKQFDSEVSTSELKWWYAGLRGQESLDINGVQFSPIYGDSPEGLIGYAANDEYAKMICRLRNSLPQIIRLLEAGETLYKELKIPSAVFAHLLGEDDSGDAALRAYEDAKKG